MLLFIGAGVSTLFDIKDTKGFIGIFNSDPDISQSNIYNEIKTFFKDDFDLEILMTLLDDLIKDKNSLLSSISPQTSNFILNNIEKKKYIDDENVKTEAKIILRKIKNIIRSECITAEFKSQDKIMSIYDRFFEALIPLTKITVGRGNHLSGDKKINYVSNLKIITTNYDRCIETFLARHQINFTQGLVEKYGHLIHDVSAFNDVGEKIGLIKLHGSVDIYNIQGIIRRKIYEEEIGDEIVYYPVEFSGYQHIIESPYLELFYLFRDRLNKSDLWIIIGSSLRDRTICSIMNDVIRLKTEGERPKIILVNPDETIIDRLKDWGFSHLSETIIQLKKYFGPDETNQEILKHIENGIQVKTGVRPR